MTSKHYGWQANWAVDRDARTATHSSGLTVDFVPIKAGGSGFATIYSTTATAADGQRWLGKLRGDDEGARAFLATQPALRDPASQANRLRRLMREAGEIYTEARHGPDHAR